MRCEKATYAVFDKRMRLWKVANLKYRVNKSVFKDPKLIENCKQALLDYSEKPENTSFQSVSGRFSEKEEDVQKLCGGSISSLSPKEIESLKRISSRVKELKEEIYKIGSKKEETLEKSVCRNKAYFYYKSNIRGLKDEEKRRRGIQKLEKDFISCLNGKPNSPVLKKEVTLYILEWKLRGFTIHFMKSTHPWVFVKESYNDSIKREEVLCCQQPEMQHPRFICKEKFLKDPSNPLSSPLIKGAR